MEGTVYIFVDRGVGPFSAKETPQSIRSELDSLHSVAPISASEISASGWEAGAAALIFPGGRDIPYHNALAGEGNRRIRAFVEGGGSYLGFCAGAYYGCASFEFDRGGELEILASRELAFYPRGAEGPVFGTGSYQYDSEFGARAVALEATDKECETARVYFNGGCTFPEADTVSGVEVLWRYSEFVDTPPAIIECMVGKGRAILSGAHPEYRVKQLFDSSADLVSLVPELRAFEVRRRKLLRELLHRAGLSLSEVAL